MYNADYTLPMLTGKLAVGFTALIAAHWVSKSLTVREGSWQSDAQTD